MLLPQECGCASLGSAPLRALLLGTPGLETRAPLQGRGPALGLQGPPVFHSSGWRRQSAGQALLPREPCANFHSTCWHSEGARRLLEGGEVSKFNILKCRKWCFTCTLFFQMVHLFSWKMISTSQNPQNRLEAIEKHRNTLEATGSVTCGVVK